MTFSQLIAFLHVEQDNSNISFHFSHVSLHLKNVSHVFTLLLPLFWSPPASEGKKCPSNFLLALSSFSVVPATTAN